MTTISVLIPTIPTRKNELERALASVAKQSWTPDEIIVVSDREGHGGTWTRNQALSMATSEYVAWLDDDDEYYSQHLTVCMDHLLRYQCDVVYTGCDVVDGHGRKKERLMEWGRFGFPFDAELLREQSYIPTSALVMKKSMVDKVGGFTHPQTMPHQDWELLLKMLDDGALINHVPKVTWRWHHHGANLSGQSWVTKSPL